MMTLSTKKEELLSSLEEKKSLLSHSTKYASSWNVIKYQSSGDIQMSKSHVKLLQKEIKAIELELSTLDK